METINCIKSRRSTRQFKDTPVSKEIIDEILDCGMHAPSGCNTQPWSFIVVKEKETLKSLSKVTKYGSFVEQAPVCIVACMTHEAIDLKPSAYMSVACAVENMLLCIEDHGLGSCWTYIKDFDNPKPEEETRKLLNIPEDVEVICMLPIGYTDQKPKEKILKKMEDIVHEVAW